MNELAKQANAYIRKEMSKAEDIGKYFRIPCDSRDLNYDNLESGDKKISQVDDYHSHNTKILNVEEIKQLLLKLDIVSEDEIVKQNIKQK